MKSKFESDSPGNKPWHSHVHVHNTNAVGTWNGKILYYLYIIAVAVNGLNFPIKGHRFPGCIKSETQLFAAHKKPTALAMAFLGSERMENAIPSKCYLQASISAYTFTSRKTAISLTIRTQSRNGIV